MTDPGVLLVHLLIVVVGARLAAELAERAGQPAVVFEILAGVRIGPSVLNLVGHNEVLIFFAEIGAILLLLQIGMEMNMRDLAKVGGTALRVAAIGIAGPMLAGYLLMTMTGMTPPVALFLAAGITATSVGITARVFGDLKMLPVRRQEPCWELRSPMMWRAC